MQESVILQIPPLNLRIYGPSAGVYISVDGSLTILVTILRRDSSISVS
jgi:hypothetical protein